jgi:hypothetical protein
MSELKKAIMKRERVYSDAVTSLRDMTSESEDATQHIQALREAVALVCCLRRLVDGKTPNEIHQAFGAPGDFGYDTPIGDALARLYRGEVSR